MRRVSSRQRLVSWDAFDAMENNHFEDSDASYDGEYSDTPSAAAQVAAVVVVSPTAGTTGTTTSTTTRSIGTVPLQKLTTPAGIPISNSHGSLLDLSNPSIISTGTITSTSTGTGTGAYSGGGAAAAARHKKRGRRRHKSQPPAPLPFAPAPAVISSYSWEVDGATDKSTSSSLSSSSSSSSSSLLAFNDLMDDVQYTIWAYLDMSSLLAMNRVNHKYRALLLKREATTSVWKSHCIQKWPIMNTNTNTNTKTPSQERKEDWQRTDLVDAYHLPMAATTSPGLGINLPLLLQLAPSHSPTHIDQGSLATTQRGVRYQTTTAMTITRPQRMSTALRPVSFFPPILPQLLQLEVNDTQQDHQSVVRYTGVIGAGDRCIRANHPLPRPTRRLLAATTITATTVPSALWAASSSSSSLAMTGPPTPTDPRGGMFQLLCRSARKVSSSALRSSEEDAKSSTASNNNNNNALRPFCAPYVQADGKWNVTPRMVAYFEVDIICRRTIPKANTTTGEDDDDDDLRVPSFLPGAGLTATTQQRNSSSTTTTTINPRKDCVAVGLATESFQIRSRMPGWDKQSFGYHGDDGGIFHSSGGMIHKFGPTFGAGDVVGCGIDYVSRGIFFTLNGQFLGYGWTDLPTEMLLQHDLYPVVGIDTHAPIAMNFGGSKAKPFQFDLGGHFDERHRGQIVPLYQFTTPFDEEDDGKEDDMDAANADTDASSIRTKQRCWLSISQRSSSSSLSQRSSSIASANGAHSHTWLQPSVRFSLSASKKERSSSRR